MKIRSYAIEYYLPRLSSIILGQFFLGRSQFRSSFGGSNQNEVVLLLG
jgi:hypothetical protein